MKLKKVLLIGGVVLSTVVILTGCGKKDDKVKQYEKEVEKTLNNVVANAENKVENNTATENKTTNTSTNSTTSGTQNSYEISYKDEEYTTKNKDEKVVFLNKRNIPTISSSTNSASAKKMEDSLKQISNKNWEYLTSTANEYTQSGMTAYDPPYGVSYMIKTAEKNNKFVTFEIDQDGSMGGVSWTGRELYSYSADNGELLTIGGIAKNETELRKFLHNQIKSYINSNFSSVQAADVDATIDEILNQTGNYGMLGDKFVVILPKYSVGSGADGVKIVEIGKGEINSYLTEKYQM